MAHTVSLLPLPPPPQCFSSAAGCVHKNSVSRGGAQLRGLLGHFRSLYICEYRFRKKKKAPKEKGPALGDVIQGAFILSRPAPGFRRGMGFCSEDVIFENFLEG